MRPLGATPVRGFSDFPAPAGPARFANLPTRDLPLSGTHRGQLPT